LHQREGFKRAKSATMPRGMDQGSIFDVKRTYEGGKGEKVSDAGGQGSLIASMKEEGSVRWHRKGGNRVFGSKGVKRGRAPPASASSSA